FVIESPRIPRCEAGLSPRAAGGQSSACGSIRLTAIPTCHQRHSACVIDQHHSARGARLMAIGSLKDLYIDELACLYDAEKQMVRTLPRLAEAAHAPDLREALLKHC